jgi:hypothetical protein
MAEREGYLRNHASPVITTGGRERSLSLPGSRGAIRQRQESKEIEQEFDRM